jgi:subtilisin family serine protease
MAEVMGKNGTWTFNGDLVRIVPGHDKEVSRVRAALGEIVVPLEAVAGVAFEAAVDGGKKARHGAGRLRMRLRSGADPFLQACGGRLSDDADPYQLQVPVDRGGVAEYFADEVRDALAVAQLTDGPVDRYLLAPPSVPVTANGQDGVGTFDGETVRLEWNWLADLKKRNAGNREWPLAALEAVEWRPAVGMDWGWIRFRARGDGAIASTNPRLDPHCLTLWGTKKESGSSALLAAAIVGRMPHPNASAPSLLPALPPSASAPAASTVDGSGTDHDALLRRLRELGELHRDGVLTAEEFTLAKQAVLKQL